MAFNEIQQITSLLEQKKRILISFQKSGKGDAIASAVALSLFLQALGKQVDIVVDEFSLPKQFHFLKEAERIQSHVTDLQKFVITVDVSESGLKELSYDVQHEKLRIYVTPKKGIIAQTNVRTTQSGFKYDLIFILNSPDLHSLGSLHTSNTELFFTTPIINIDHQVHNEHFGQVNVIDTTATATTEILFDLFKKINEGHITAPIATALLTGIITNTHSFKTDNIKPQTLTTASNLIKCGADREYIVKNLYRTRTIASLKLWGQALTHLQTDKQTGLVWMTLTRESFVRAGAREEDLYEVIDELIANSPEAKIILLLHEHADAQAPAIHGLVRSTQPNIHANSLVSTYNPIGDAHESSFIIPKMNLMEASELLTEEIKEKIKK